MFWVKNKFYTQNNQHLVFPATSSYQILHKNWWHDIYCHIQRVVYCLVSFKNKDGYPPYCYGIF